MKEIFNALVIAPYDDLANQIAQETGSFPNLRIDIRRGNLEDGLKLVQEADLSAYDVIISRGGTAAMIQEAVDIPVIDVKFSAFDILRSIQLAENHHSSYAVIGFPSITSTAEKLCELLKYRLEIHTISSRQEVVQVLKRLRAGGISLVIGDQITYETAAELELPCLFISSGIESIREGLAEAEHICALLSAERLRRKLTQNLLRMQDSLFYILTEDGGLFFTSERKGGSHGERILSYLRELDFSSVSTEADKKFHMIDSELCLISSQRIDIRDEAYYLFTIYSSQIPTKSSKYGIRHFNCDEAKTLYHSHFYSLSTAPSAVAEQAERLAASNIPLMLLGERGAGKDPLGMLFYLKSGRTDAPFITVDCKRITDRYWNFLTKNYNSPLCDNGNTIHISNLQDLSSVQRRELLSLIIDTSLARRNRLILSCSLSAKQEEDPARDFIDYLPCASVLLPPLRELPEDIPRSASLYLNRLNMELSRQVVGFTEEGMELLAAYSWPDNFFQLQRVFADLVSKAEGPYIDADAIRNVLEREKKQYAYFRPAAPAFKPMPLRDIMKEAVLSVLEQCGGNQSMAARTLGISRSTMWRYLK